MSGTRRLVACPRPNGCAGPGGCPGDFSLCERPPLWQNGRARKLKRRNLLLAFTLLALFAAAGVVYFRTFVQPKPFGIVVFVGEGLVSGRLTAARLYEGGADHRLAIGSLPNLALITTHAADFAVPDAASAASAIACGVKVNHRALSTGPDGDEHPTLLELARRQGRAVGLVTTGCLTDPAPAAFYAHARDCRDRDPLAAQLIDRADLDVMLGGGGGDFRPGPAGGRRRDARDLVAETAQRGYTVLTTRNDLLGVDPAQNGKLFGLFAADALPPADGAGGPTPPTLSEAVRAAIETLQRRAGGYLLVVDAGSIGRAALANDGERAVQETLELDRAVSVALQYAGTKTLVLVAGGEATGGLSLNGYPLRGDHGVSLLGMNAEGLPSITWATGPAGPLPTAVPGPPAPPNVMAPAAFYSPYAANVADDAIAAGFGPGAERLRGFQDNTFIFELVKSQL